MPAHFTVWAGQTLGVAHIPWVAHVLKDELVYWPVLPQGAATGAAAISHSWLLSDTEGRSVRRRG